MNYVKLNSNKFHLLISENKNQQMWARLDRDIVWESNDVKLLRITLDSNLKFDKYVSNICSKANRKLSALTRVAKCILYKAFIESQFKYFPLTWMFHERQINDKIYKLHERVLMVVYNDTVTSFEELLVKDKTFTIHHQNIQSPAIEM